MIPSMRVLVYSPQDQFLFELPHGDVFQCRFVEQVNGEHSLAIVTTQVLNKPQRVLVKDTVGRWREYVVSGTDRRHENGERPFGEYRCVWSLQADLSLVKVDDAIGYDDPVSADLAIGAVLSNTSRWTMGTVDVTSLSYADMIQTNAWSALATVVQNWGGEVDAVIGVDATGVVSRQLCLLGHLGSEAPTRRFDYTRDLTDMRRKVDEMPLACRIRPYGKGEKSIDGFNVRLTIESVNDGLDYLQNDEMVDLLKLPDGNGGWEYPTVDVEDSSIDDPEDLLEWGESVLVENTTPKVTYEATLLQLSLAGMDAHGVSLGDEVQCVDRDFSDDGVRIQSRIMRLEWDGMDVGQTNATLGEVTGTMSNGVVSRLSSEVRALSTGAESTADYLEHLIENLNAQINMTGGYTYITRGQGIRTYSCPVSDPLVGDEAKALIRQGLSAAVTEVRGGTIRIANSLTTQGEWDWKTVIISGHIAANLVTAANITAGYIGTSGAGSYWDLDHNRLHIGPSTQLMSSSGGQLQDDRTVAEMLEQIDSAGVDKIEYGLSDSSSTEPPTTGDGAWSETVPSSVPKGRWIWIRTTYVNGGTSVTKAYAGTDGANGTNGYNTATITLYKRASSQPSKPSARLQYTFATHTLSGELGGWTTGIPAANGDPCWVTAATATSTTASDYIETGEWVTPTKLVQDGTDGSPGTDGLNQATVFLYQRAASKPSKPSSSLTYTFASGALSGTLGSWKREVQASDGNPCWVTSAAAIGRDDTDTIGTGDWSDPTKMVEDGTDAYNTATVMLYKRAASQPSKPSSTLRYTFATHELTGTLGGWSTEVPTVSGDPCWVTAATATSTGTYDDIGSGEWASPTKLVEDGTDGLNQATIYLYQRASSKPSVPSSSMSYAFASGTLTGTFGLWSREVPTASGDPCWVTSAAAISSDASDDIGTSDWSDPTKMVEDGTDAYNTATVMLYQRAASQPSVPSGTIRYTFASGNVSGTLGLWETSMPASDGNPCWATSALAVSRGDHDDIAAGDWGTPQQVVSDGADGTSVSILGSYDTLAQLEQAHPTGDVGDGYMVAGDLYVWNGTSWQDVGTIRGPQGDPGTSVTVTKTEYGTSSSASTSPSSWSQTAPTSISQNTWLWCVTTFSNGSTMTTKTYVGKDGSSAYAYYLTASPAALVRDMGGSISPSSITFSASRAQGTNAPSAYSGRFIIAEHDGSSWTTKYTSSSNESSKSYSPTSTARLVRCTLYLAGGTSTQLDVQTVPIASDGDDSYSVWLTNESHTFPASNTAAIGGDVSTYIKVYKGTTLIRPVSIGTLPSVPTGMSLSKLNDGSSSADAGVKVTVTTSLTTKGGTIDIPLTADGHSFTVTFSWALALKGDTGDAAYQYAVSASPAALVRASGGTLSPSSVTFSSTRAQGTGAPSAYSGRLVIAEHDGSSWANKYTSSSNESSKSYSPTSTARLVRCVLYLAGGTSTQLDVQTVPIATDGAGGSDAYTLLLTNESHTFAGDTSKALANQSATSSVIAYKGTTQVATKVGTITGAVTGLSASISNNETTSTSITFTATTSLTTRSGVFTIPVTVDGKSFSLTFSWSLALQGATGKGISSVTEQYARNNSSSSSPSSGWGTSVLAPTSSGKYVWNREVMNYTDGTSSDPTTPHVVAVYGDTGSAGKGISSITNYYAATNSTSAPADSAFSTTVQQPTATNRYLWNYESIAYTTGNPTTTAKRIIGVYGQKGDTGIGITSIVNEYLFTSTLDGSTDAKTPTGNEGWWSEEQGEWQEGQYIWTRSVITWDTSPSTTTKTAPVRAEALESANMSAHEANGRVEEVNDSLDVLSEALDTADHRLSGAVSGVNEDLETLSSGVDTMRDTLEGQIEQAAKTATNYFDFDDDGGLLLGITTDSRMKNKMTATSQQFTVDGVAVAGVRNVAGTDSFEMFIQEASVDYRLSFGNFRWINRSNGNMSLKWVGMSSHDEGDV